MEKILNKSAFYLSNFYGKTDNEGVVVVKFISNREDIYQFECNEAEMLTIFDTNFHLLKQGNHFEVNLTKEMEFLIKVETRQKNKEFFLKINSIHHEPAVPYEMMIENKGENIPLFSQDKIDPLKPSIIEMKKRKGGTYLYSNVPESMPLEAIDSILMQNKDLVGDCFLTFEHQNASGLPYVYLGYRIVNHQEEDIYVTVRNVGYQVTGSWLGEKSWMDYYGVKYDIDISSFDEEAMNWFKDYLNFDVDYQPKAILPTTYRIPKGKYIYVIGGTSEDAYQNINVNHTADLKIAPRHCVNANAFFTITNGKATGELCAYVDYNKLNQENTIIQNLRRYGEKDDLGGRIGQMNHHGVIDVNPLWVFNDLTPSQNLPVVYYPYYADTLKEQYEPFEKIEGSYKHEYKSDRWLSHLSSQLHHEYIGEDMVEHETIYQGERILLSSNSANPLGKIWDYGNWMIEYQENCVFVNQGDQERKLRFYLLNGGSIYYIIKDESGKILKSGATLIHCTGKKEAYECTIKGHSRLIVSVQFVLAANNNGSVEHIVELI